MDGMDKPPACPPRPQEQNQKKRTFGALPKPDNFIRYRQPLFLVLREAAREWRMPPREWFEAKTQFAIMFDERFVQA